MNKHGNNTSVPVVGIDIGGVIITHSDGNSDTSFFSKHYLKTPACDGAFAAIRQLAEAGIALHLVSKCGETVEGKTRKWLSKNGFYEATGVSPDNVHFCRERADKAAICARLGVTHFVDDRLEVLSYLQSVPHQFLFCPRAEEVNKFRAHLPCVQRVSSWIELIPLLERTLAAAITR